MRIGALIAVAATTLQLLGAASAESPEEHWRTVVASESEDMSTLLKMQDEAILADGATATVVGVAGKPESYHWEGGTLDGAATVSFHSGQLTATVDGQTFDGKALEAGVHVGAGIDIQTHGIPGRSRGAELTLYNAARPEAVNFKGLDYFPYDPAYRVTASFMPDPKMPPRMFRVSKGADRSYYHAGDAVFTLNGKTFTLPLYTAKTDPRGIEILSAFFVDKLTGTDAYEAGRYLNIQGFDAFPPQTLTLDFNFAYNPLCARSSFYSCPIATDSIDLAVRAGEKDPHLPH